MSRKTSIFGLITILAIATFIWVLNQNRVQPVQDIKNPPSANQSEIENLPESSAIKQTLTNYEKDKEYEKIRAAEFKQRSEIFHELKNELGLDHQFKNRMAHEEETLAIYYPAYSYCIKGSIWENEDEQMVDTDCVFRSFLVDRVSKNKKLKESLLLVRKNGLILFLGDTFKWRGKTIFIDINASDDVIINCLTKNCIKTKTHP